jgi:hypothetical protein
VTSGPKPRYVRDVAPGRLYVCARLLARFALAGALAVWLAPGCSLAEGTGTVTGVLDVPDCWSGPFNLQPTFFAAIPTGSPYLNTGVTVSGTTTDALQLRIQNGGDFESFSDGLAILIDDDGAVLGYPTSEGESRPSLLGQNLVVSLPVGVEVPGVPVTPVANPSIVHATLYLQKTCRTQNLALYALSAVTTNPDGTCDRPDGGVQPLACGAPGVLPDTDASTIEPAFPDGVDASTGADGGASAATAAAGPIRSSWINFTNLFDGNPDEADAQKRLTQATFEFFLADPREICPGGLGPPPRCLGDLKGSFKFYFERGQPAQPFP